MFVRRSFIAIFAVALLGACAGPAPKQSAIDSVTRANLRITDVTVDVSGMGTKTQGRAVSSATVQRTVGESGRIMFVGHGKGSRNARAVLAVDNVNIITAGQSIMIGGESTMSGTVSLVDARTGERILPPTKVTSGGGGWAAGGLIAVATRDDANTEVRQLSQEFVARSRILVFGKQIDPVISGAGTPKVRSKAAGGAATSRNDEELDNLVLEARIEKAQMQAEHEARSKFHSSCSSQRCERAVTSARKEAEKRVRREAAQN